MKNERKIPIVLLGTMILMSVYGAIAIYGDYSLDQKQLILYSIIHGVGLIIMAVMMLWVKPEQIEKIAPFTYILGIVLMTLLKTPLIQSYNGAAYWIHVGDVMIIRPATLLILATILMLGYCSQRYSVVKNDSLMEEKEEVNWRDVVEVIWENYYDIIIPMIAIVFFAVTEAYSDSYTYLIVIAICFQMFRKKSLLKKAITVAFWCVVEILMVIYKHSFIIYQFFYEMGDGESMYAIVKSCRLTARTRGGFLGVGIGNSKYMEGMYYHNDTFTVVWEELGVIGVLAIVALFVVAIVMIMNVYQLLKKSGSVFGTTVCFLIGVHFIISLVGAIFSQTLLTKIMFNLPFFSAMYGDVLFYFAEIGIVLSLYSSAKMKQ